MPLSHKASLNIRPVEHDVLILFLNKPHLVSMKNSAALLHLNAQVRRDRKHTKMLSEKTLLCIDANATSLHLPQNTTTQISYRIKPMTDDIFRSMLVISHALHFQYYGLTTRVLHISSTSLSHLSLLLRTTVEGGAEDSTARYVTGRYRQSPPFRYSSRT